MARTKNRKPRSIGSRRASTIVGSRKHSAAERLTDLATATRQFTTSFDDLPYLRDYTGAAAKKIGELAEYVSRTDMPHLLEDVAALAKRQPVATFALGVAAGLATTQLVRRWPLAHRGATGNSSVGKSGR